MTLTFADVFFYTNDCPTPGTLVGFALFFPFSWSAGKHHM